MPDEPGAKIGTARRGTTLCHQPVAQGRAAKTPTLHVFALEVDAAPPGRDMAAVVDGAEEAKRRTARPWLSGRPPTDRGDGAAGGPTVRRSVPTMRVLRRTEAKKDMREETLEGIPLARYAEALAKVAVHLKNKAFIKTLDQLLPTPRWSLTRRKRRSTSSWALRT